ESSRKFISRSVHSSVGTEDLFRQLCSMVREEDFLAWVRRTDEGQLIAYAELKRSAKVTTSELELIYVVSEIWRGKGIATSFVRDILDCGEWAVTKKIVAYVNPDNVASLKVLRRNRFVEVPSPFKGRRFEYGTYV